MPLPSLVVWKFGPWKAWEFKRSPHCQTSGINRTNSRSEWVSEWVSDKITYGYVTACYINLHNNISAACIISTCVSANWFRGRRRKWQLKYPKVENDSLCSRNWSHVSRHNVSGSILPALCMSGWSVLVDCDSVLTQNSEFSIRSEASHAF